MDGLPNSYRPRGILPGFLEQGQRINYLEYFVISSFLERDFGSLRLERVHACLAVTTINAYSAPFCSFARFIERIRNGLEDHSVNLLRWNDVPRTYIFSVLSETNDKFLTSR